MTEEKKKYKWINDEIPRVKFLPRLLQEQVYPRKWAKYDLAKVGTLYLVPAKHIGKRLRKDYADIKRIIRYIIIKNIKYSTVKAHLTIYFL